MAYTGTGTRTDPYIVNTWDDYLTLCINDCYIKWEPNLTIDTVTMEAVSTGGINSTTVPVQALSKTDFNGLTINTFSVTNNSLISTSYKYAFNSMGTCSNLHIKHLRVATPSTYLSSGGRFLCCYFDDVQIENGFDFTQGSQDTAANWCTVFSGVSSFICCRIHTLNTWRCPTAWNGFYLYCELTYDINLTENENYYIFAPAVTGINFTNCYVKGVFKVASEDISTRCNIHTHQQWTSGMGAYNPKTTVKNTIYNFIMDPIIPETIKRTFALTTSSDYFTSDSSNVLWVDDPDNRLNCSVTTEAEANGVALCAPTDISNKQFLTDNGFTFLSDDNFRNVQYSDAFDFWDNAPTNPALLWSSDDWSFRLNPMINNGRLFLPFYNYPIYTENHTNRINKVYMKDVQPDTIMLGSKYVTSLQYDSFDRWEAPYPKFFNSQVYRNEFSYREFAAGGYLYNRDKPYAYRRTIEGSYSWVDGTTQRIIQPRTPSWGTISSGDPDIDYYENGYTVREVSHRKNDPIINMNGTYVKNTGGSDPYKQTTTGVPGGLYFTYTSNNTTDYQQASYYTYTGTYFEISPELCSHDFTICLDFLYFSAAAGSTNPHYLLRFRIGSKEYYVAQSGLNHAPAAVNENEIYTDITEDGIPITILDDVQGDIHTITVTKKGYILSVYMDGILKCFTTLSSTECTNAYISRVESDETSSYISRAFSFYGFITDMHVFTKCLNPEEVLKFYNIQQGQNIE